MQVLKNNVADLFERVALEMPEKSWESLLCDLEQVNFTLKMITF